MTEDQRGGPTAGPAAVALRAVVAALDARDWETLGRRLAPGFTGRFVHSGETFDRDGYVALNRDYPGRWALALEDLVADGSRGVFRARVTDADGLSAEVHHVAGFGTVDDDGRVVDLVEVWAEETVPPADRR